MHHADVFDFGDVKAQAKQLIDDATTEAQRLVKEGKSEAERLTSGAAEEGYKRGLEQGLTEGRERGQKEGFESTVAELTPRLDATLNAWNEALERWDSERTCMFLEARRDVLELAMQLARKIVHRHVAIDPDIVADQLTSALSFVGKTSSLVVTINPKDRDVLDRTMQSILDALGRSEHMTLREDEAISPGGCIVRTEGGRVDASIESQLDRLTESLLPSASAPATVAPEAPQQTDDAQP